MWNEISPTSTSSTSTFDTQAYATIRRVLGKDLAVYVGDMFNPKNFNCNGLRPLRKLLRSRRLRGVASMTRTRGGRARVSRHRRDAERNIKEHATHCSKRRVLGLQGQRAPGPLERGRERLFRLAHLRVLRRRFEGHDAAAAHPPGLQI